MCVVTLQCFFFKPHFQLGNAECEECRRIVVFESVQTYFEVCDLLFFIFVFFLRSKHLVEAVFVLDF